ncbi:MAG: DUF5658 family protein [Planctomycetota bacterium]
MRGDLSWRLFATRPRRVVFALALVWVFSIFDVAFTFLAHQIGGFEEGNPLAREFIHALESLVVYKVLTVGPASLLLLLLWRRKLTEIACWIGCGCYLLLSLLWVFYFAVL